MKYTRPDGREGMIPVGDHPSRRDLSKLAALVDAGAVFSPELSENLLALITEATGETRQAAVERETAFAAVGLINGQMPNGHLAVTPDGPAEEYLPGFFLRPDAIRFEDGWVTAILADTDGHGQRRRIIGVCPQPLARQVRRHWTDGLTWTEIQAIIQADEDRE